MLSGGAAAAVPLSFIWERVFYLLDNDIRFYYTNRTTAPLIFSGRTDNDINGK